MAAVAGICRRLEGLPLAIELAAARLPVLSPEQIDARLGDRLGLLTRGSRASPARQQTLRASIEWSYELCSRAERLLWARLSVFAGGFELDAAEGICADHRLAAERGAGAAGRAGRQVDPDRRPRRGRGPVPAAGDPARVSGRNACSESGEYTALRRRHRDWHEQLARRADTGWLSPQIADLDGPAVPGARQRAGGAGLLPGRAGRGRGRAAHRAARLALLLLERGACQRGPVPARPGAGPGRRAHRLAGAGAAAGRFPGCRQRRPRRRTAAAGAGHRPGRAAERPGHAGVRRLGRGTCLLVRR